MSVRGHSYSVIFNRISSKFHIWIASINLSFKFEYGFCTTSDDQDGRQNGRHLSISAVLVSLSFLIGFLPNFVYGLLSSSHSSSNRGFVRHPITKMADKMPATYQYPLSWSLSVILIGFLPNFIYGLLPSTSRSISNAGFVRHLITKMADKMAATYQYPLSWSL